MWIFNKYVAHLLSLHMLFVAAVAAGGEVEDNKPEDVSLLEVDELEWPNPNVDRVITGLTFDYRTGPELASMSPKGDPKGWIEKRNGKRCLIGAYFLFDVDEEFAYDVDETLVVDILFDTATTRGYALSYDGAVAPRALTGEFPEQTAQRFEWQRLELPRARFADRRFGVDFTVGELGSHLSGYDYEVPAIGTSVEHRPDLTPNIAICDLKVSRPAPDRSERPTGVLELIIRDEHGRPTQVRAGIYASDGWMPLPGPDALQMALLGGLRHDQVYLIRDAWPGEGRYAFYMSGRYKARLPQGRYQLVLKKGQEYEIVDTEIVIQENETTARTIDLKRWVDMPATGWYSGDNHVHLGDDRASPGDNWIFELAKAEDVHLVSLLQGVAEDPASSKCDKCGFRPEGRLKDDEQGYALVSGQEGPTANERGHGVVLNTTHPHHTDNYLAYHDFIHGVHEDGGLFGYAHLPYQPLLNPLRGMVLDIPFGDIDFVEVLQAGELSTNLMYDFLNMGFKVTPTGATDFPYLVVLGGERTYARLDREFSAQAWFDALKAGHVFASSGPILQLTVNGADMGEELLINAGSDITISAMAGVTPGLETIDRIELVAHGEVIESKFGNGSSSVELTKALIPEQSFWLAVRAYGTKGSEAHSAPTYVYVDGNRHFGKSEAIHALVEKYKNELDAFLATPPDWEGQNRYQFTREQLERYWNAAFPRLELRVTEAKKILDEAARHH